MAYLLADIYRVSPSDYTYDSSTDTHTFTTTGASVGGYAGTYLKGFPTRDLLFENRVTVHSTDLAATDEYIILWAMDSPDGAEDDYNITVSNEDYSGRRSTGFGIAASLQLRLIGSDVHVCLVQGDPTNTPLVTTQITLETEFHVRAIFQRSTNSVADPVRSNGRLKVSFDLTHTEANTELGWNGAWRYEPMWGCVLHPDVATRGNENKVSFRAIEQGNTYVTSEDDECNVVSAPQQFTQVLSNPDRVYST